MAFLWGETPPDGVAEVPSPTGHLDRYQVRGAHGAIRRWLEGGHLRYAPARGRAMDGATRAEGVAFADLTPPWLGSGLRVAKAVSREAAPPVFGDSPFAAHLPKELRLHPIP
jgi:hypothetical protein